MALALSFAGLYQFAVYFNDVNGLAASFLMNLSMSILYISLLFKRPNLSGLSYGAAWFKMLGTMSGALFSFIWWPRQFESGILVRPPFVHEPINFHMLYFLYLLIPMLDGLYTSVPASSRRRSVPRRDAIRWSCSVERPSRCHRCRQASSAT